MVAVGGGSPSRARIRVDEDATLAPPFFPSFLSPVGTRTLMKNNSAVPRLSQGGRKGKSKTSLLPNKAKSSTSLLSRRPFSLAPNTSKRSPARRKSPPVALRTHPLRPTTAKPTPTRARVSEPFPRSSARSPAEQHRKRISLPLKLGKNLRGTKGKTVFDGLGKRGRAVASSSESGSSDSESDSGSESESGSADDQDGSRDETDETHRMDNGCVHFRHCGLVDRGPVETEEGS